MKERPILFSAPMVRAILEGRKTQTRRAVKPQPVRVEAHKLGRLQVPDGWRWDGSGLYVADGHEGFSFEASLAEHCPYGSPGDRLWVRETWAPADGRWSPLAPVVYRADGDAQPALDDRWRPSIHMPRWASRLTLEVTGVRVELWDVAASAAFRRAWDRRVPAARAQGGGLMCTVEYDDDPALFHSTTERTARKKHRCHSCGGVIRPGDRYRVEAASWERGSVTSEKACAPCAAVADAYSAEHEAWWMPRGMRDALERCVEEERDEASYEERAAARTTDEEMRRLIEARAKAARETAERWERDLAAMEERRRAAAGERAA